MRRTWTDGQLAFGLATLGVAAAVGFTVWALTASVYSHGGSLLSINEELSARAAVAAPVVVASLIWLCLHRACRHDSRAWRAAGLTGAWLVLAVAVLAGMSFGAAVLPAAAALLAAALITPVSSPRAPGAQT